MLSEKDRQLILGIAKGVEDFKKEIKDSILKHDQEISDLKNKEALKISSMEQLDRILKPDNVSSFRTEGYNITFGLKMNGLVNKDLVQDEIKRVWDVLCPVLVRIGVLGGQINLERINDIPSQYEHH